MEDHEESLLHESVLRSWQNEEVAELSHKSPRIFGTGVLL